MFLVKPNQFGTGFQVPLIQVPAMVRGGNKVKGQLVLFDFANSDAACTDNNMDGGTDSGFGNVIAVTDIDQTEQGGIYGVLVRETEKTASPSSTIRDDHEADVVLYGVCQALIFEAAGAGAKYDNLYCDQSASATALVTTPAEVGVVYRQLATLLETVADADPAILARVWFYGGLPFGAQET